MSESGARIARVGGSDWQEWRWENAGDLPEVDSEIVRTLHWSLEAIREAKRRCTTGKTGRASWTPAVEGTWWAMALDEQLGKSVLCQPYKQARAQDDDGQMVHAMRWLRNRHSHQMVTITGEGGPKKNFFSHGVPGALFYISPVNRWRKSDQLPADERPLKPREREWYEEGRRRYDDLVARRPLTDTMQRSVDWFTRVFSASGWGTVVPTEDDPTCL